MLIDQFNIYLYLQLVFWLYEIIRNPVVLIHVLYYIGSRGQFLAWQTVVNTLVYLHHSQMATQLNGFEDSKL